MNPDATVSCVDLSGITIAFQLRNMFVSKANTMILGWSFERRNGTMRPKFVTKTHLTHRLGDQGGHVEEYIYLLQDTTDNIGSGSRSSCFNYTKKGLYSAQVAYGDFWVIYYSLTALFHSPDLLLFDLIPFPAFTSIECIHPFLFTIKDQHCTVKVESCAPFLTHTLFDSPMLTSVLTLLSHHRSLQTQLRALGLIPVPNKSPERHSKDSPLDDHLESGSGCGRSKYLWGVWQNCNPRIEWHVSNLKYEMGALDSAPLDAKENDSSTCTLLRHNVRKWIENLTNIRNKVTNPYHLLLVALVS